MNTYQSNPQGSLNKIKLILMLEKVDRSTVIGDMIYHAINRNTIDDVITFVRDQIADGHSSSIIRSIGMDAYQLIIY